MNNRSVNELRKLIFAACKDNNPDQLRVLIEEYNREATTPIDFSQMNNFYGGHDALYAVYKADSPELFELMMQHGLSQNNKIDSYYGVPLHEAIRRGNVPLAQFLVDIGVDAYPPPDHPNYKEACIQLAASALSSLHNTNSLALRWLGPMIGCEPFRDINFYERALGLCKFDGVKTFLELFPEFTDWETVAFNRTAFNGDKLTSEPGPSRLISFLKALIWSDDWETFEWGLERIGVVRDPLLPVPVPPDYADTYIQLKKAQQQIESVEASFEGGGGPSLEGDGNDESSAASGAPKGDLALWTKADLVSLIDQLDPDVYLIEHAVQMGKINAAKYCRYVLGLDGWMFEPIPPVVQEREQPGQHQNRVAQNEPTAWSTKAIKTELGKLMDGMHFLFVWTAVDVSKCFRTPLHLLPRDNPREALDWMVSEGIPVKDSLNHPDKLGLTALEHSVQCSPAGTQTLLSLYDRLDPANLPRLARLAVQQRSLESFISSPSRSSGLKPLLEAYFNQFRHDIVAALPSANPSSPHPSSSCSDDEIDAAARAQVFALVTARWDQYTSEFTAHDHKLTAFWEAQAQQDQADSLALTVARHVFLQNLYEKTLWYEGANILWFCVEQGRTDALATILEYADGPESVLKHTLPRRFIPRRRVKVKFPGEDLLIISPCPIIKSNKVALEAAKRLRPNPPSRPRWLTPGMTLLRATRNPAILELLLGSLVDRMVSQAKASRSRL